MKRFATLLLLALMLCYSAGAYTLSLPTRKIDGRNFYVYKVEPKETLYHITRTLGLTRQQIVDCNPQVADGLRAGDVLLFPADECETPKAEPAPEPTPEPTPEPALEPAPEPAPEPVPEPALEPAPEPEAIPEAASDTVATDPQSEVLRIAVMLPFMLENENMTRQAENFTNFYKGFLLAVDSLGAECPLPIELTAVDTAGSLDSLRRQLELPQIAASDFIIAPDDSLSINLIARKADTLDAIVINAFAVKNQDWLNHESLIQTNIPHDRMYEKAIRTFCDKYARYKTVILNATDLPAEKSKFTDALRRELVANGIPYEQVDYTGKLSAEQLTQLASATDRPLVFLPTSHSREVLMRITPAIEELSAPSARLFGYPEWVALRGDIKKSLHALSTTVYSRFSPDQDSPSFKRTDGSYRRIYGTGLGNSMPLSALIGFDTAAWLMQAADRGIAEPYRGIQNAFNLAEPTEGQGFANDALYIVEYRPDGKVDALVK